MKLKIEIESELWVQCLHAVNKLDLDCGEFHQQHVPISKIIGLRCRSVHPI